MRIIKIRSKRRQKKSYKKKLSLSIKKIDNDKIKVIKEKQNEFEKKIEIINSRWKEEGEKSSKYFCNLVSQKFINKQTSKLKLENNQLLVNQEEILNETKMFYENIHCKLQECYGKTNEKILTSWKFRNVTPIGRITVIKTLIIQKLNHLILSTPNPLVKFLIDFERKYLNFVLNNKPNQTK